MSYLADNCTLTQVTPEILAQCHDFSCGDTELDEFFLVDSSLYQDQLLTKCYCFYLDNSPETIACFFSLSNESIRVDLLPNSRKKKVNSHSPREKQMKRYPAVLLGRIGVNESLRGNGIGSELMDFIKFWFLESDTKSACRYLAVDAYNTPDVLSFYQKNGFKPLFSTEEQEAASMHEQLPLKTRFMYYDLIELSTTEDTSHKN